MLWGEFKDKTSDNETDFHCCLLPVPHALDCFFSYYNLAPQSQDGNPEPQFPFILLVLGFDSQEVVFWPHWDKLKSWFCCFAFMVRFIPKVFSLHWARWVYEHVSREQKFGPSWTGLERSRFILLTLIFHWNLSHALI